MARCQVNNQALNSLNSCQVLHAEGFTAASPTSTASAMSASYAASTPSATEAICYTCIQAIQIFGCKNVICGGRQFYILCAASRGANVHYRVY